MRRFEEGSGKNSLREGLKRGTEKLIAATAALSKLGKDRKETKFVGCMHKVFKRGTKRIIGAHRAAQQAWKG
jgi:hypothetical protein